MSSAFAALSPAAIRKQLAVARQTLLRQLTVLDVVDSTNLVLQRFPADQQHGHAVIADQQSAGRGRRGRNWHSPSGQNIYLSVGWSFQQGAATLTQLPLAAAVMVTRALERAGLRSPGIKWPNDIQVEGRKLGGILVEMRSTAAEQALAVIGIGINVSMPVDEDSRVAIDQPWTDVCAHLTQAADRDLRNRLCGMLIDELLEGLKHFSTDGFGPFASDWDRWDALRGKEVAVSGAEETVVGTATGISDSGGLLVACAVKCGEIQVREFFAGDVSIRPA